MKINEVILEAEQTYTLGGKKLDPRDPNDAQVIAALQAQQAKNAPPATKPAPAQQTPPPAQAPAQQTPPAQAKPSNNVNAAVAAFGRGLKQGINPGIKSTWQALGKAAMRGVNAPWGQSVADGTPTPIQSANQVVNLKVGNAIQAFVLNGTQWVNQQTGKPVTDQNIIQQLTQMASSSK
jgi:hypothetical protein